MFLRVGHVSSWGRSEAVFADQACCLYTDGTVIGLCIEQGRLKARVSQQVPPTQHPSYSPPTHPRHPETESRQGRLEDQKARKHQQASLANMAWCQLRRHLCGHNGVSQSISPNLFQLPKWKTRVKVTLLTSLQFLNLQEKSLIFGQAKPQLHFPKSLNEAKNKFW